MDPAGTGKLTAWALSLPVVAAEGLLGIGRAYIKAQQDENSVWGMGMAPWRCPCT
jgi:hypothetical protein